MKKEYNSIAKNKAAGIILMLLSIIGICFIVTRLFYYVYEYDAQYSPIDYGQFNILSYFTIQSNFFIYLYFFFAALSIFGVKKAEKIGFNPTLKVLATVYVVIAGITYCAGIPMGMTPPFKWESAYHIFSAVNQIYYHMLIPPAALIFLLLPFTNEKASMKKCTALSGIYPLVYSLFSLVRGAVSQPTYYPYPFYNPEFIWNIFFKDKPVNLPVSYLIIAVLLVLGISLFAGITALLLLIYNKRVSRSAKTAVV